MTTTDYAQMLMFFVGLFGIIAGAKGWIWKEPALKAIIILISFVFLFFGLFALNLLITVEPIY